MKRLMLRLSTFLVLLCCYSVIAGVVVFSEALGSLLDRWAQTSEMDIYLNGSAKSDEIEKIKTTLNKHSDKIEYVFVSQDKALQSFKHQLPEALREVATDSELMSLVPSYITVTAKHSAFENGPLQFFEGLASSLREYSIVEDINFGKDWMKKYQKIIGVLRAVNGYVLAALSLSLLFVVGNSLRAIIYAKREEVEILELVGATQWFIRKPFYIEGVLLSVIGMFVALLAVNAVVMIVKSSSSQVFELWGFMDSVPTIDIFQSVLFIIIAGLMGLFASWLCLSTINDGWAASRR